uniref:Aminotransferase class I/classII domain-containing protein n=1 Tax=Panagrolaimus sp. ES5 TaxID=591445 RepID=A0AC34F4P3_9BILA
MSPIGLDGITEYFGVDVIDIDMIMASLENALATTGGFCAGRSFVVGHQRLSGLGYCFSASLPPLLATAASEALRILQNEPDRFQRLNNNSRRLHYGLKETLKGSSFKVIGDDISPMQHVIFNSADDNTKESCQKLDLLLNEMFDNSSILVTRSHYLEGDEAFPVQTSLKFTISSEHTAEEIDKILKAVKTALPNVL